MKRPLSVTIISWVFILAGVTGIIYHASDLTKIAEDSFEIWILIVRLLAILGGWFALKGANWARWLLITWIAYHVGISFYHTTSEIIMHSVLLIITVVALVNPKANLFFKK